MIQSLPQRLEALRLSLKLLQKEMALKLSLPVATYRSYETGKRTPPKLALPELERRMAAVAGLDSFKGL